MRGLWAFACLFPSLAGAETLADEVRLGTVAQARAICAEVDAGGRRAEAVQGTIYVVTVPPGGFAFSPYDERRARLTIDTTGFRSADGLELTFNDLIGTPKPGGLELSVPASADEAATLRRATLFLDLWFRLAPLKDTRPCAATHRGSLDGLRLAVTPLAFELREGTQRVASGETPLFASLRAESGPVLVPRVVVGAPLMPGARRAPAKVLRAAQTLKGDLVVCYRRGLQDDPFMRGPLALGVELGADGRVTEVRAELDGLGAPDTVACAMRAVRGTRFPRGAARLSIPLKFSD